MDDLEAQLQQLLQDPEQMKTIRSLAESLGISPPSEEGAQQQEAKSEGNPFAMLQSVAKNPSNHQRSSKSEALLQAIKPFLRPERQQKLERAIQLARLSRVAGTFLQDQNHNAP